jgi:acetylornithine deacetylase/succinyl-diaminopimelate desuccinylase-like protein
LRADVAVSGEARGLQVFSKAGRIGARYFGVDGTFMNEADIACVGLGPGNEYLAHTPNNVVPVSELIDAARIYTTLILDICD